MSNWIDIEDDWPREQQVVIAGWPDGTVTPCIFNTFKGELFWEYADGEVVPYTLYPTHWMPLPTFEP